MTNKQTHSTDRLRLLPLSLAMGMASMPVLATDWIVSPGVTLEQIYTDNVYLRSDEEKKSESITLLKPRLSIYRHGARANLDIRYAPQYRYYWNGTRSNDVVHFLKADGDVELIEEHLFVDGWASADQHTLNSSSRTGIDSVSGSDQLTEVYTAGITPRLIGELGRFADIQASHTLNRVEYSQETRSDSTGNRTELMIGNERAAERIGWDMKLEHSRVDYDLRDEDDKISRAIADLSFELNRRWALTALWGYEDYQLALRRDRSGEIWNLGFVFTPSARTRLAAGIGKRTYGDNYYLNFSHRTQRTIWTADYKESFISARDEVIRPNLYDRYDASGNLVNDPVSSNPVNETSSGPTLSEDYYLLKSLQTQVTLNARRTSLSLAAGYTEREYDTTLTSRDTSELRVSARATRQLQANLNAMLRIEWKDHEEDLSDYEQWRVSIGGSYELGLYTSLRLTLSHLERDASTADLSYTENRASLRLDRRW